jgi:beta-hydroxylase
MGALAIQRLERFIAWGSTVGNPPVFDNALFPWATAIEHEWPAVRAELDEVLRNIEDVPPFQEISRDQEHLSNDDRWKTYFFYAFGYKAQANCNRCPVTTRLVEQIPGMTTAFYSILAPGKHLPDHRGAFKGLLRYHLGVLVPEPKEKSGIRVGSEICHWDEGASLIFDDTYRHEAWNYTDHNRAVLFVDFKRPLRFPANLLNWATIEAIKHSPFVKDGIANYERWEKKLDHVD